MRRIINNNKTVEEAVNYAIEAMLKDMFVMEYLSFDEKIESVREVVEIEFQYHPSIDMIKESMINHGITA